MASLAKMRLATEGKKINFLLGPIKVGVFLMRVYVAFFFFLNVGLGRTS